MGKMKQRATSLLTIVFVMLISSCNLFIDEDFRELPSDEKSITHTGDGYNEPTTVTGRNYYITYQYQPNVRVLTDETQGYIKSIEQDELGWTYIIYFDENAPEDLLPRKGEVITCDESEKLPYGIAAEVLTAAYMDHAYIVCAAQTELKNVFKTFTGDINFNVGDEAEDDDNNSVNAQSKDMKKSRMDDEMDDEEDDEEDVDNDGFNGAEFKENSDGTYSAKFRIPVDFNIKETKKEEDGHGNSGESERYLKSDGNKSFIQNDITISGIHFGDITSDESFIQWYFKNNWLADITIEGNANFKKTHKETSKNLLPKNFREFRIPHVGTLRFQLKFQLSFSGEIGFEGFIRQVSSCDVELNTVSSYLPHFSSPSSTTTPHCTLYGKYEQRVTLIASFNMFGGCLKLQFRPYLRTTYKSSLPTIVGTFGNKARYDLTKNHALSVVVAPGLDIVGVFGLKVNELVKEFSKIEDIKLVTNSIKDVQVAIHQYVMIWKVNSPDAEKDGFMLSLLEDVSYGLKEFSKELDKIVEIYGKIVDKTGNISSKNIKDVQLPEITLVKMDGENSNICLSKKWYWFPKFDDKSIYLDRPTDIKEGEKQRYYMNIYLTERGIYVKELGDKYYPFLDIYKITDNGVQQFYKLIPLRNVSGTNSQAVIEKDMVFENNIGHPLEAGYYWNSDKQSTEYDLELNPGETYKAYVCYSFSPDEDPVLYDKPITIITKIPEVVISDVRDLDCIAFGDNGKYTYTFKVYLTVKGAKQFSNYKFKLINDKGYYVHEYIINKPKDVKNKEFPFEITRSDDKPFTITIEPSAVLKEKKSNGVTIEGAEVKYKPVKILVDYWENGEIQILNE